MARAVCMPPSRPPPAALASRSARDRHGGWTTPRSNWIAACAMAAASASRPVRARPSICRLPWSVARWPAPTPCWPPAIAPADDEVFNTAAHQNEPGRIACLHAIGLGELLRAYQAGQHVWLLAHGDCAACPRGQGEKLSTRLAHLNAALRQRGRRPIVLREVTLAAWSVLINAAGAAEADARRGFFRALTQKPASVLIGAPPVQEKEPRKPPGEYLPEGDDALMPWVIRLNASRCVGCHACSRVCPEGAIQFDAAAPAYRLRQRACTGCGLCQDVCLHQAVTLQPWAEPTQWALQLVEKHCPGCGVDYYAPAEIATHSRNCWVCDSTQLKRRLYQVMN
jgi:ferredoxin